MLFSSLGQDGSIYAFPPIKLLRHTLDKIRRDQVEEAIVIALAWTQRDWYALLIQMACKVPCQLITQMDLLSQRLQDKGTIYHSDLSSLESLHLAAWN